MSSTEVHVFATVTARPDTADQVRTALVALVASVRKDEPGNLQYMLHEDPKQAGHFYVFEVYKDQAAADAHMTSPHLANAFATAGALLAAPPVIIETKQIA